MRPRPAPDPVYFICQPTRATVTRSCRKPQNPSVSTKEAAPAAPRNPPHTRQTPHTRPTHTSSGKLNQKPRTSLTACTHCHTTRCKIGLPPDLPPSPCARRLLLATHVQPLAYCCPRLFGPFFRAPAAIYQEKSEGRESSWSTRQGISARPVAALHSSRPTRVACLRCRALQRRGKGAQRRAPQCPAPS